VNQQKLCRKRLISIQKHITYTNEKKADYSSNVLRNDLEQQLLLLGVFFLRNIVIIVVKKIDKKFAKILHSFGLNWKYKKYCHSIDLLQK